MLSRTPLGGNSTDALTRFRNAKGNMMKVFSTDVVSLGSVLAVHPRAAAAIPQWSCEMHQYSELRLQAKENYERLIDIVCTAFTRADDEVIPLVFNEDANDEFELKRITRKLAILSKCKHNDAKHQQRVAAMAAALCVAEDDKHAVANAVGESSFSLLIALPPQRLGRALQSGLMDSTVAPSSLASWTQRVFKLGQLKGWRRQLRSLMDRRTHLRRW